MIWLCVITSCVFALYLLRENRLRNQGKRDYRYEEPEEERNNMGDDCKFLALPSTLLFVFSSGCGRGRLQRRNEC